MILLNYPSNLMGIDAFIDWALLWSVGNLEIFEDGSQPARMVLKFQVKLSLEIAYQLFYFACDGRSRRLALQLLQDKGVFLVAAVVLHFLEVVNR
jgi:hypothetical protein